MIFHLFVLFLISFKPLPPASATERYYFVKSQAIYVLPVACAASISSTREANSFIWQRKYRVSAKRGGKGWNKGKQIDRWFFAWGVNDHDFPPPPNPGEGGGPALVPAQSP